jgi:hypothetical protein
MYTKGKPMHMFGIRQSMMAVLPVLCLLAIPACEKSTVLPVVEGHYRVVSRTEIALVDVQSIASSWGIVASDIVRKPVALQLQLWLPCDASVGLSCETPMPPGWEGGLVDGAVNVRQNRTAERDSHFADAVIDIAGLVDYHYRAAKPFPVLLISKKPQAGGSQGSLTWSNVALQDLEQDEPFFRLVPVEDGVHAFEEQLEIAKFMGKPVVLKVTPLE